MKTSNKFILAGAFALALTGAAAGAIADGPGGSMFGGGHHGCQKNAPMKVDMMRTYLESRLALTDAQKPAWNALVEAVDGAVAQHQATCEAAGEQEKPATALAALDGMEARLSAGLDNVRTIRAAVSTLYDELDADQRATFDGILDEMHDMRG